MINDDKRVLEHFNNLLDNTKDKEKITVNRQNIVYLVNKLEKYFKQAERVQELEERGSKITKIYGNQITYMSKLENENINLQERNKRYREILNASRGIIKDAIYALDNNKKVQGLEFAVKIINRALEGEE